MCLNFLEILKKRFLEDKTTVKEEVFIQKYDIKKWYYDYDSCKSDYIKMKLLSYSYMDLK